MEQITKEELKVLLEKKEDFFLINILSFAEFKEKHIPLSHNIPADSENFKEIILETINSKKQKIVVYSDHLSQDIHKATETIKNLGYENVLEYSGGVKDWEERFALEGTSC